MLIKIKQLKRQLKYNDFIDEPKIHRKHNCDYYELCLLKAARHNWISFSCEDCEGQIEKNQKGGKNA